ncbi:hypothetical protein QSH18_00425 [Xanthomonas sp. NCPPB 2654]|nr:hypothetical protein [Xanthomonas sp. NCPPB 2654]
MAADDVNARAERKKLVTVFIEFPCYFQCLNMRYCSPQIAIQAQFNNAILGGVPTPIECTRLGAKLETAAMAATMPRETNWELSDWITSGWRPCVDL